MKLKNGTSEICTKINSSPEKLHQMSCEEEKPDLFTEREGERESFKG